MYTTSYYHSSADKLNWIVKLSLIFFTFRGRHSILNIQDLFSANVVVQNDVIFEKDDVILMKDDAILMKDDVIIIKDDVILIKDDAIKLHEKRMMQSLLRMMQQQQQRDS